MWFRQAEWIVERKMEYYGNELMQSQFLALMMSMCHELEDMSTAYDNTRSDRVWRLTSDFFSLISQHCTRQGRSCPQ